LFEKDAVFTPASFFYGLFLVNLGFLKVLSWLSLSPVLVNYIFLFRGTGKTVYEAAILVLYIGPRCGLGKKIKIFLGGI
jgi:hypothetical protein